MAPVNHRSADATSCRNLPAWTDSLVPPEGSAILGSEC